jgi:ADP-ribose pyrophosphatase YjhB (NUDIX family)
MSHQDQTTPKIAVNALVFNEAGEVLLVKRTDNGLWCIPGGHVDLGETLSEACCRELFEETGLRGEVVKLIGIYSDAENSLHIAQGREWHTARVSLLCRVLSGERTPSAETSEIRYFKTSQLPPLVTDHSKRIAEAVLNRAEAFIH